MQERSAKPRGWVTGLLRAGRAAAFLTLATGINGLISAYFAGYEPIYVYLVAVVVVALTSGLLLGVTSAVAAVIVYDWMFAPVHVVPSMSMAVPLAIAVAAAVATRAARIPFQPRAILAEPVPPPQLPGTQAIHPIAVVDDDRVVELEKQLAVLRATADTESRLRAEAAAAARMREAQLERELQMVRSRAADEPGRSASTERERQEMAAKVADAESRVTALHQELDVAWRKADEERARADREATLRQQLEEAGRTSLQQTIADLTSKHDAALDAAGQNLTATSKELSAAREQLDAATRALEAERLRTAEQEAAVAVARGEAEKLRNRAEKLRVHLEEERARAAREADMRQGLQSSAKENLEQTIRQISSRYESELASAKQLAAAKDVRIAELETAVDAAVAAVQQERGRAERETGLRAQLEVAARETLQRTADVAGERQRAAAEAREAAAAAERRAADLAQQLADLQAGAGQSFAEREAALRAELEHSAGEAVQSAAARTAALEGELAELRAAFDQQVAEREAALQQVAAAETRLADLRVAFDQQIAEREASLRNELSASNASLQQGFADMAAKQRQSAEAVERAEAAERRAAMLERHLEELRVEIDRTLAETQAHSESIESELVRVRSILETETARADRETELREQAEIAAQQTQALLNDAAGRYDSTLTTLRAEAENERAAAAAARDELVTLRAALSAEREQLATARAERQRLMSDFDEKLQTIVNGITTDYEHAIGEATVDREAARAEVRDLTTKLQKAQEAARSGQPDDRRLEAVIAETASRYETALTAARQALEAVRAEAAAARQQAESAQTAVDIERAAHERTRLDFDSKLQAIVSGITSDHEQALGEALIEKESARAEARNLSAKLQDVQRTLLGFDEVQAKVQKANDQLQAALAEARNAAQQERAAREKSEAEWSEKLQSIVTHLASDHESDLGEAMLAKEAARAEARTLSAKVAALQERMEEDREKFRAAFEKWTAERASLQQQLQTAQQRERPAPAQRTREEPFPAASHPQPVILFVHSDVGIRAMWKHTLEQAGYTILTAADGLEGLRTASQHRPDVVVAETIMPKMNARELIQLLKSKRETAGTKIVLLGGTRGDAERASDYRADGIVQNPSDFRALRETLANVLAM